MRDVGCDELSLEMCLTPPQNIFDPKNVDTMHTRTQAGTPGKPTYRGGTGPPKKCTPYHDDDKVLRCFEFSLNEIYYQE